VLDRLAQTLFRRAQMEPAQSPNKMQYLQRALARYQEALSLDPEMLDAHFGIHQCYDRLASVSEDVETNSTPTAKTIEDRINLLLDTNIPASQRTKPAHQYRAELVHLNRQPLDVYNPRLPMLHNHVRRLTAAYNKERDPNEKSVLATALSATHQQIHSLLKPDELAKTRAIRTYRSKHPAASAAADPIVLYPTDHDLLKVAPRNLSQKSTRP
jgi:hypothetical protein